jgi:DNA-binding NarL/FixJ family response regulator
MLEAGGFEVVGEASDGADAVEAARELAPDVVLLDVQLPDANGIDLAGTLTADGGAAVILTSSRPPDQLGPKLTNARARAFIPKDELSAAAIVEVVS